MAFTVLKTPRKRQKIGAYDLEWRKETGTVTTAGFLYNGVYKAFTNVKDMLVRMLTDATQGVFFYAHSGGRHDMTHMIGPLADMGYTLDCHVVGSRIILCIVRGASKGEIWYLADSFAVLKASLAEIGKSINLPKIEGDTDEMSPRDLYERNKRDCEIVVRALELYQDELWSRGAELKHTIGACAMGLFRRTYLKEEIRTSKIDNAWCRGAYHAARVEVLLHEDYDGIVRDLNSAYPWAMTQGLPGELVRIDKTTTDSGFWCADAEVSVPYGHIPPLPYRHNSRIYFPTGNFRTKLTRPMADLLYEYGGNIVKLYEVHHYQEGLKELGQFSRDMYDSRRLAKKRGDIFLSMTRKYEGNTPYGKLCENAEKTGIVVNPDYLPPLKDKIAAGIYKVSSTREVPHSHTIAGVWITDLVKCRVTRELWALGEKAAYCDTDCTHGPDLGTPDEDFLGGWEKEFEYVKGERLAAKLYYLQGKQGKAKLAAKGFAKPTYDDFTRLKEGLAREYEWFATPREVLSGKAAIQGLVSRKSKRLSRQCPVCYRHLDGIGGCPLHGVWGHTVSISGKRARVGEHGTRPWDVTELGRKGL